MTLFGEGRSEGVEGLILIGMTILNRARSPVKWWGNTIKEVCLCDVDENYETQNGQFSCWNDHDHPNFKKMISAWADRCNNEEMEQVMWVVKGIIHGHIIKTATYKSVNHYHAIGIMPYWARGKLPVVVHKGHSFYSL